MLGIGHLAPHLVGFNCGEEFFDDVRGGDVFRLGLEVEDDPVFEDLAGDASDIVDGDGDPVVHQGSGFGADDQILGSAGARPPIDPLVDEPGGFPVLAGTAALHELNCISRDVLGDRNARN